jgi:hypothetical protein
MQPLSNMEDRMKINHGTSAAMSPGLDHPAESARARTSSANARSRRSEAARSAGLELGGDFRLQDLAMLSIGPVLRSIHRWWLQRAERHYLICADVELQRAREAQMNVAYYQKRAALARSARN